MGCGPPVPALLWHTGHVQRNRLVSLILVVIAVIIAWALVQFVFTALWALLRVALVVVVAVAVYVAATSWLDKRSNER